MEKYFRRKIYNDLLKWKESNKTIKQTALLIKGARQVGKTTIVNEFAHNEYENVVYINFMMNQEYKNCFTENLDVDNITSALSRYDKKIKFVPNKTILILDEIQECARARTSIKSFCLDGRYDVIATGSLLGVNGYNKFHNASIPVGFETQIKMYPMDFLEFLWALGYEDDDIQYFKDRLDAKVPIDESTHEKMFDLFKWYMHVGGMPDAVSTYLKTKNINDVRKIQNVILDSYRDDFGKHLNNDEKIVISNVDKSKLNLLYDSIPRQLAKSENLDNINNSLKFKFSEVSQNGKFRDYVDLIQWLSDAGLINVCHNLKVIESPISAYSIPNYFKIFMNDTGLFLASLEYEATKKLWDNSMQTYKGYVFENLVADQLCKNGFKLYYWEKNPVEIDFVIANNESIFALEVKSSNGKRKSLNEALSKSEGKFKGIKLARKNIGFINGVLTIPYYLAFLLDENFNY